MGGVYAGAGILIHGNRCTAADGWLPFLEELGADDRTVLIGHSSGAVAALRYAESHRLLGSVLVGVCHTDLGDSGERASGYYSAPWRWDDIRRNQQWIGIFQSDDDPHIPVAEARSVAARLRSSYFELTGRGHFASRDAFPELVRFVRRKLALTEPLSASPMRITR